MPALLLLGSSVFRLPADPVVDPLTFLHKFPFSNRSPDTASWRLCTACPIVNSSLLPLNLCPASKLLSGYDNMVISILCHGSSVYVQLSLSHLTDRVRLFLVAQHLAFPLSEIDFEAEHSTVHLASQHKKETVLTPSRFKAIGASKHKPLDKL
jgi:hypothetical protein